VTNFESATSGNIFVQRDVPHTLVRESEAWSAASFLNCGISIMKHVTFPAAAVATAAPIAQGGKQSKRTGFFARLLDALHHSRRIQARRYLVTNRHLLADDSDLPSDAGDHNHADR
jgi:hypothetical protein